MTPVTLDASVVCKWFLADRPDETHVPEALLTLAQLRSGRILVVQPPHWLAEVAGVLVRRLPEAAEWLTQRLLAMNIEVIQTATAYRQAVILARSTRTHVFDTLYHAVAVEAHAILITADERYYQVAHTHGRIELLKDWRQSS